jgi:nucleotide-binding universal stress UspA family protein
MVKPVVVGVDGSEESMRAVDMGLAEARLRRIPLRIVHAFIWPTLGVALGPAPGAPEGAGLENAAQHIVDAACARVRALHPDQEVHGEVVVGAPASVLLHESTGAALVVVGDRGLGGFTGLLVGSVAVQLAHHCQAPILVARGVAVPDGSVIVGVDGSERGEAALAFAFDEASRRGLALTAVHAWQYPVHGEAGEMLPLVYDPEVVEAEEARVLEESLAGWQEQYPDVVVHRRMVRGRSAGVLMQASTRGQLLVVGSRGHGGFVGLLLGSVSHQAIHHSACPVAIVRPVPE